MSIHRASVSHSHMTSTPHVASIKELVLVMQKRAVYNSLSFGQSSAFMLTLLFHYFCNLSKNFATKKFVMGVSILNG